MLRRQTLPRLWLMTDERLGERLLSAVERLPRGAGIVFRHYSLPESERRALFDRVKGVARRRRLLLLLAGPDWQARAWGADGSHGRRISGRHRRRHRTRSTAGSQDRPGRICSGRSHLSS